MIGVVAAIGATVTALILIGFPHPSPVGTPAPTSHTPGPGQADQPRVVLWGDSMAWEARTAFATTTRQAGADVLTRTFGGTAICDWLADIRTQAAAFHPTTAVLAFSGNQITACMTGRDLLAAYRQDVMTAVRTLTAVGARVLLVDAPPRPDQTVGADGLTELDRIWQQIRTAVPGVGIIQAGLAVTDRGRWASRLPCRPGERCDPDGQVTVRSPDGVHFCPQPQPPMTACPTYDAGAERYGDAMARGAVDQTAGRRPGSASIRP